MSSPMSSALRQRPFRRLVVGLAASQAGDWLYNVALLAYVFERTGSTAWLAATTAARVLPVVVLGPLGGVLADRHDRRRLMILADVIRAGLMVALLASAAAGLPVIVAPVLAALATAAGAPYPACTAASVARLVPSEDLAGANAVRSIVGPVCIVLGPVLGAAILAVSDAQTAFGLNALTFVVSAIAIASIPAGEAFCPVARAAAEKPQVFREMAEGATALLSQRGVLRLVGADILASCVYGVLTVALVLVGERVGASAGGYGMLLAAIGVGGVAGAALGGRLANSARPRTVLVVALVAVAAPLPLLGIASSLVLALALAAVGGVGAMVVEVLTETTLQRDLDDAVLARAYGFAFPASIGGICAGAALAAPLIGALGLAVGLTVVGLGVAGYALWLAREAGHQPTPSVINAELASTATATRR
jgi:predicted MFS family arabinose efflux permease